jgi:hypothetical protein
MEEIIKLYQEEYVGKEFVYDGKYGRTFGIVDNVFQIYSVLIFNI